MTEPKQAAPKKASAPRSAAIKLPTGNTVTVYAKGSKVAAAIADVTEDMTLYHGVRFSQIVEAVYEQGIRDGRRQVVEGFNNLAETKELAYRNPGRPAKKQAATKRQPRKRG